MKIGKVVLVLNGRYAGRKAVVVKVSFVKLFKIPSYSYSSFTSVNLSCCRDFLII